MGQEQLGNGSLEVWALRILQGSGDGLWGRAMCTGAQRKAGPGEGILHIFFPG